MRDEVPRILSGHFCLIGFVSAACPPRIGLLPPEMRLAPRADNVFVLTLTISTMPKENFRGFLKLFSENLGRWSQRGSVLSSPDYVLHRSKPFTTLDYQGLKALLWYRFFVQSLQKCIGFFYIPGICFILSQSFD